jgi:putative RecB family exonuclease
MTNYSYSRMATYDSCPFSYYLKYELKNYSNASSIALEFGTAVHAAEEAIAKAIKDRREINYISIKNKFLLDMIQLQIKYPIDYFEVDKSYRTYEQKAFEYLNNGIYRLENYMKNHPTYKIIGIEFKFSNIEIAGQAFKGAIDRVIYDEQNKQYIIQDIKTWPVPTEKEHLVTPLQFVTYFKALQKSFPDCTEDNVRFEYDLPICNLQQPAGTKGFISRGIKKLENMFNKISEKQFKPNPSPLCNWCSFCSTNTNTTEEFKYLCPYHSN